MQKMKLATKLMMSFLAVGLIPAAVIGILSLRKSSSSMEELSYNQLVGMRDVKKGQIEQFFAEREGDMNVLVEIVGTLRQEAFRKLDAVQKIKKQQIEGYFAERIGDANVLAANDGVATALAAFKQAFEAEGDKTGGEQWTAVEDKWGTWLTHYKEEYGYYDLFLIAEDGDVVYTVAKESDLGEDLAGGRLKDSPLGNCFKNALSGVALQDFEPYAPSNNEPCAFVGAPVKQDGKTVGIVALQLPLDAINTMMQQRDGMGKTGECYLVGSDKLMRSDSFLDPQGHSVKASFAGTVQKNGCDTDAVTEALAGKTAARIISDYNDNPVLSAFTPIKVGDTTWALLAEVDEAEAFAARNAIIWMTAVTTSIAIMAIVALAIFITRSITKPVNRIIEGLSEGSEQVSSASAQVSSSSQSLAEGASEQAAGLEETSSSLEEMASMTKRNAESAQQANTLAAEARTSAEKGNEAMVRMSDAITDIQKSAGETAKIIKVIDEIAFQTNLLALNAAVEAARAGEAGKGFAVVAEEVRNLAMRSAEAAKNTSAMIEESVKNSESGVNIAGQVAKMLEEITTASGKVNDLVAEIAAASQEQTQGIDQVNTAVNQMDKVTQQNAANAEESASASEELNAQAEQMNAIVAELSALVGGAAAHSDGIASASARRHVEPHKLIHPAATVHAPTATTTDKDSRTSRKELIPLDDDAAVTTGKGFDEFSD